MISALGPAGRSVGFGGPGAKVAGKLPLTRHLLDVADEVAVGGAMATSFLAAQGYRVGRSRRHGPCSGTARWEWPMFPQFSAGTRAITSTMARSHEFTVIGGGDTGAAVRALSYPRTLYRHVSTGGGSSLEFLSGRALPGLVALERDAVPSR